MAVKKKKTGGRKGKARGKAKKRFLPTKLRAIFRILSRIFWALLGFQAATVFVFAFVNPPTDFYMLSESRRLGGVKQDWVRLEDVSANMGRAVVAAEDANFCQHWGFDLGAIRAVVTSGGKRLRGASTLSQQVAKNVFLWPDRSWFRKALEAETTLMLELLWSKRRIVEVYINVAEFDEGVFGVGAAAPYYFGVKAKNLTLEQAARLAAVLPNPKGRSASRPSAKTLRRVKAIISGARTIEADGRDRCFQ
ncbi:MAG: monofunctional biosynthetic peptidoglycan transglycosylase [Alphaproteobacteria bacterium]|nr:monofunctional biosynthetic peptidoglycan transglycosylase [Alphaproteobacteria bacterium]